MNGEQVSEKRHQIAALWVGLIIESLVLIAMQGYNMYEIRRNSELLQSKINGLAEYSSRQGEKIDRMTTALEMYVGKKLKVEEDLDLAPESEKRIEKAKVFLQKFHENHDEAEQRNESEKV